MNSKISFGISFVVGFVLTLGLASIANAQTAHIEVPTGSSDPCLEAFTRAYNTGNAISDAEAVEVTRVCVDMDVTQASFFEGISDVLNGPTEGPETFRNIADVMGFFRTCRVTTTAVCPGADEEETPEPSRRTTTSRLVVECRGACAEGPGITNGLRGRGWNRVAVCREGTVPLSFSWRHAVVGDETRRRAESGTALDITYCFDPATASAPRVIERDVERVDLSGILERLDRLENACGPEGMRGNSDDWDELCTRFEAVVIHTTRISELDTELSTLRSDLDALRAREDARWAADCGKTNEEWNALSESEQLELIRSGQCDGASNTTVLQSDWHLRFHLGLAFHGLGITAPAGILAPHGVVYAEIEALPVEHFGFFLRGYVGAGNLLDRIGQFNPDGTIGDEGIFGGSAGATFRLDEMFAFDLGVASSAVFNPGGQIGRSLHTWPVFQLGGEVRLRVNPLPWLHIEGTAGLDYAHTEVRRPNVDHFVGVDGVGYHLSLGAGVSF